MTVSQLILQLIECNNLTAEVVVGDKQVTRVALRDNGETASLVVDDKDSPQLELFDRR